MTSATAIKIDNLADTNDLSNVSLSAPVANVFSSVSFEESSFSSTISPELNAKVSAPVFNGFSSVGFEETSFSSTISLEPRHQANPMLEVFTEDVLRMWLDRDNHVSISNNHRGETNIRVINEQTGSAQIADILKLDEAPKSIAVSPSGNDFLLVLKDGGVFQYTVTPSGKLTATFAYIADSGSEVLTARYDDQDAVKISTRRI